MDWSQLRKPTREEIIESLSKTMIKCVETNVAKSENIVELFQLYIEYHFHNSTTDLEDDQMSLMEDNQKYWSKRHRKIIKIIKFHQTTEGKNLLASIAKDRKIDSSILQPYIDMLNDAGLFGSKYDNLIKVDFKKLQFQLDETTSMREWRMYTLLIYQNLTKIRK